MTSIRRAFTFSGTLRPDDPLVRKLSRISGFRIDGCTSQFDAVALGYLQTSGVSILLVRDVWDLGSTSHRMRIVRDLARQGCEVLTLDGPAFPVNLHYLTRVLDVLIEPPKKRGKLPPPDAAVRPGPKAKPGLTGVRKGAQIARLLRSKASIRQAASLAGVSPNTVVKVRRFLREQGQLR